MRNAFASEITQLASTVPELVLLSGDIGNRLFDEFKSVAPNRFFNCGVSEANMIGMAAGMAASGLRPVAYTITPFITYRPFEQIRVDLCYHNQPVIIVGVGSGMGYASLGATHHSCEDIAIMRSLPNMQVLCPGDSYEVIAALRQAITSSNPVYIRIGKKGEPKVHATVPTFSIGKGIPLQTGKDVCILATGTILHEAKEATLALTKCGVSVELVSFPSVKPLDTNLLSDIFSRHTLVATLEEHSRFGGLGSAVLEWMNDSIPQNRTRVLRMGTGDEFFHEAGEREHALEHWNLSTASITEKIKSVLK